MSEKAVSSTTEMEYLFDLYALYLTPLLFQ
jgi:hypothetical protein